MNEKNLDEILEAIWEVREKEKVTSATLQNKLGEINKVDGELINSLIENDLIKSLKNTDNEIVLTDKGEEKARSIIRRHRLAEILVEDVLSKKGRDMHVVGCEFEHIMIPEVEESICILLGHPTQAPDGSKIPPGKCCITRINTPQKAAVNISELNSGESGKIAFIRPKNHARMHRLMSFGLNPGTVIQVHQTKPALVIQYENTELAIDEDVAEDIFIWKISKE